MVAAEARERMSVAHIGANTGSCDIGHISGTIINALQNIPDCDQAVGLGKRQGSQQYALDDREDGSNSANAKS